MSLHPRTAELFDGGRMKERSELTMRQRIYQCLAIGHWIADQDHAATATDVIMSLVEEDNRGNGNWTWAIHEPSGGRPSFVMHSTADDYGIEFYFGGRPELETALAMRLVLCADICAGLNPAGIPLLIQEVEKVVAAMRHALGTYHDPTNILPTLETALRGVKPLDSAP